MLSPPSPDIVVASSVQASARAPVPARFVARRPGSGHPSVSGAPPLRRTGSAGRGLTEFGPLTALVSDPTVTDVFVNGADDIWVDRGGGLVRMLDTGIRPEPSIMRGHVDDPAPGGAASGAATPSAELDEEALRVLAVRLIAAGGRHVDEATPCVDVRLHDGIRVHVVLPPVSPNGTLLSIRLPRVTKITVDDLERDGFFSQVSSSTVRALMGERRNILLSGAGGSGKTTFLSALLALAPPTDRIVAIEDVGELRVDHPHFVSLEARQPNLEGAGEIGLQRLVHEALRMRPDRLVLGECRGAEIRELLAALNTGHDGGAGTLHANSLADVPARLEALGALADLSPTAVARQAVSAIDAVLHLERVDGCRRLAQIGRFALDGSDRLRMVPLEAGAT